MAQRGFSASAAIASLGMLALGACDLIGVSGCTLIGCAPGLAVTLSPAPGSVYSVELIVPGDTTPRVVDCSDAARCYGGVVMFSGVSAQTVTVVVKVGADEFRRTVQPTYTTTRPNGPRCDPVCRNGAVTIVLPVAGP